MSVAYYIVTREEPEDLDTFVNGKALAHLDDGVIDQLCEAAGVRSLLDFLSQDPEELEEFLEDEGIDLDEDEGLPDAEWFAAEEGLAAVRGLLNHLRQHPKALQNTVDILEDLQEYEAVLLQLAERKIAWHLALDF